MGRCRQRIALSACYQKKPFYDYYHFTILEDVILLKKTKTMKAQEQIGNIVATDYRSASIFRKYGIDFCCGGGKTVEAACQAKGIDMQRVLSDLEALENKDNLANGNYNEWELARLIDHIVNEHHAYVRTATSDLLQYLHKVAKVHGDHNPELIKILSKFQQVAEELENHMHKEEFVLFPYIKSLEYSCTASEPFSPPPFGTIRNPITMMENEHEMAGQLMEEIKSLSQDYTPPGHACNTYRVSFNLLAEFEEDLHKHVHLENNILFPKAVKLEDEFLQS